MKAEEVLADAVAEENELDPEELEIAAWIKQMQEKEVSRLQRAGAKAIPLKVKNMAIVRETLDVVLNRVEVDTNFSMDKISQILIAEETAPVPNKPQYVYVNVLLLPAASNPTAQVALVMPYVYDAHVIGNSLTQWVFINNKMERSHHVMT
ncbi:hypothetical protein AeMF1_017998 [Aphanomyces euteiches]|nr:hypothetical protein AeMF1_017998 [Aphanomyces euteiches]KAH9168791.1 hypothetical protein AeNC1_017839 [Aphanomyces euteiches]